MGGWIFLQRDPDSGRARLGWGGQPLAAVAGLLILVGFLVVTGIVVQRAAGAWQPYQGTVISIGPDPVNVVFGPDGLAKSRVVIRTDDGRELVRIMKDEVLVHSRIQVGDYVRKEAGWFERPRADGKPTVDELLERRP